MYMVAEQNRQGFALGIEGEYYHAEPCAFRFPESVWERFPAKTALVNELAYVSTLATPLILKHPHIHYSTATPRFYQTYQDCFEQTIPNLVEWISKESSEEILERFRSLQCAFNGQADESSMDALDGWDPRRVILPLSFGKDSLLSLVVLQHLGYEVIPVNLDERIQPRWNRIREKLISRLEREHKLTCLRATNEIQLLSDYQVLGGAETRLYQMQLHFIYLFAMLPFSVYYRAPTIILSNEYPNTLSKVHREGLLCPHKYMQSREGMNVLANTAEAFSDGQIRVANLIGGLGNFAIHRILHETFPRLGEMRYSCHLEVCEHKRWCHNCERCAQAYIFSLALGMDPETMGFEHSMLTRDKAKHFRLFNGPAHPEDDFRRFIMDEERLAFLMALQNACEGELIERFRITFFQDAKREQDELMKRVFCDYSVPTNEIEQFAKDQFTAIMSDYVAEQGM